MKRHVCLLCGWIYDPEIGDSDARIDPGIDFKDLPENWVCPVCGASKEEFEEEV